MEVNFAQHCMLRIVPLYMFNMYCIYIYVYIFLGYCCQACLHFLYLSSLRCSGPHQALSRFPMVYVQSCIVLHNLQELGCRLPLAGRFVSIWGVNSYQHA